MPMTEARFGTCPPLQVPRSYNLCLFPHPMTSTLSHTSPHTPLSHTSPHTPPRDGCRCELPCCRTPRSCSLPQPAHTPPVQSHHPHTISHKRPLPPKPCRSNRRRRNIMPRARTHTGALHTRATSPPPSRSPTPHLVLRPLLVASTAPRMPPSPLPLVSTSHQRPHDRPPLLSPALTSCSSFFFLLLPASSLPSPLRFFFALLSPPVGVGATGAGAATNTGAGAGAGTAAAAAFLAALGVTAGAFGGGGAFASSSLLSSSSSSSSDSSLSCCALAGGSSSSSSSSSPLSSSSSSDSSCAAAAAGAWAAAEAARAPLPGVAPPAFRAAAAVWEGRGRREKGGEQGEARPRGNQRSKVGHSKRGAHVGWALPCHASLGRAGGRPRRTNPCTHVSSTQVAGTLQCTTGSRHHTFPRPRPPRPSRRFTIWPCSGQPLLRPARAPCRPSLPRLLTHVGADALLMHSTSYQNPCR